MNLRHPIAALLLPLTLTVSTAALADPQAVTGADGAYLGFDGISVQGTLYDVRFVDGSFDALFGGVPQFALASQAGAAANALRLAIVGVPALDAEPSRMHGCGSAATLACYVLTPDAEYSSLPDDVDAVAVRNGREADAVLNGLEAMGLPAGFDTALDNIGPGGVHSQVWAIWSPAAAVSEPGSLGLLAAGLGGIGASLARRRGRAGRV